MPLRDGLCGLWWFALMNEKTSGSPQQDVLTLKQAAALLQLSEQHVRDLARRGKIPAGKIGKSWRFSRRALLRLLGEDDWPPPGN
jgi:excisionase family DNA binding protein